jgi:uncharacterized protein involved in outer membrane biogenesis
MTMRMRPKTLLISLTTAITLYALLGFLIIPAVALHLVNKQFEQRATVPARLESIKLNPFTLELTLAGLHIGEPEQPQVSFARLYANLQIDSLWTRAVHLRDVELEQASTRVQFAEDGTLNLTELFILPEASEPADDNDSGPFPLRIDRLALIGNSLQFQDLRPAEPVEFGYDAVDIELTHLSTLPDDNTLMQISASGPWCPHRLGRPAQYQPADLQRNTGNQRSAIEHLLALCPGAIAADTEPGITERHQYLPAQPG